MGTRTVWYKQRAGHKIAERESSRKAEKMTERKRLEAGSSSESWRKEKYCWGAAQGDGERQRDREQGREMEKENKRWGAGQRTRKRKIRQGRRPRSRERKKGQKKRSER